MKDQQIFNKNYSQDLCFGINTKILEKQDLSITNKNSQNLQIPNTQDDNQDQTKRNYLDISNESDKTKIAPIWNQQDEVKLFNLFQKEGSKWTSISEIMQGRTQNDLKNKFYGGLRKFIRKTNTVIKSTFQNLKKQLKYCSVYRIIDASDSLITLPQELMSKSIDLKHRILQCSHTENKEISNEQILNLVEQINQFNLKTRSYKPKKLEKSKKENICKSQTESKVEKPNKKGFLSEPPRKKPASLEQPSLSVDELTIDLVEIPDMNPSSTRQNMMMIIDDLKSYQQQINVFNQQSSLDSLLQDMGQYPLEGQNWFQQRI